jgi:hypothetical protein
MDAMPHLQGLNHRTTRTRRSATQARLLRALLAFALVTAGGSSTEAWSQDDGGSRSERKAEEKRMKALAKAEKKAYKDFEKAYKERQERHYDMQQTSREKNLIVPEGRSKRAHHKTNGHAKDNVRKRMRKGQQKARRNRDGRSVAWWRRIRLRQSWKKG